jgi:hypothetical protein
VEGPAGELGEAVLRCRQRPTRPYQHTLMQAIGDDVSPGIKAGGRINWIRRTIPCTARGDAIPSDFTIDIRWGRGQGRQHAAGPLPPAGLGSWHPLLSSPPSPPPAQTLLQLDGAQWQAVLFRPVAS